MDGQTVLPGDWVALPQSCRLGPGLYDDGGGCDAREDLDVRTCMAGVLRKKESGGGEKASRKMAWVDYSTRKVSWAMGMGDRHRHHGSCKSDHVM